jgi:hypothetical protein
MNSDKGERMESEIIFITVTHSTLATPIRVVNHHTPLRVLGAEFHPMPFVLREYNEEGTEFEIDTDLEIVRKWARTTLPAIAMITFAKLEPLKVLQQFEGDVTYREGAIVFVVRKGRVFA